MMLVFSFSAGLFAQNAGPFLSRDSWLPGITRADRLVLDSQGELFREIANGEDFILFPGQTPPGELEEIRTDMRRYFGTETLLFLPSGVPSEAADHRQDFLLSLYNLTRKVSTLEGMDYYSASRGYRRTLFFRFFPIDKAGSRTPLPDPLVGAIPRESSFRIFQEDATFGDAEYEITYRYEEPVISLTLKNLTTLVYKIVPVAGKEKLYMYARIIPVSEGFLFYGACLVEGRDVPVIGKSTSDSLKNRVKALFEWFSARVALEFPASS